MFRYRIVGDVRGKGLMIGIEMVEDKETKKPLSPAAAMMAIWPPGFGSYKERYRIELINVEYWA